MWFRTKIIRRTTRSIWRTEQSTQSWCLDNTFHKRFNLPKGPLSSGPVTIQARNIVHDDFKQIVIFNPDILIEQDYIIRYDNEEVSNEEDSTMEEIADDPDESEYEHKFEEEDYIVVSQSSSRQ